MGASAPARPTTTARLIGLWAWLNAKLGDHWFRNGSILAGIAFVLTYLLPIELEVVEQIGIIAGSFLFGAIFDRGLAPMAIGVCKSCYSGIGAFVAWLEKRGRIFWIGLVLVIDIGGILAYRYGFLFDAHPEISLLLSIFQGLLVAVYLIFLGEFIVREDLQGRKRIIALITMVGIALGALWGGYTHYLAALRDIGDDTFHLTTNIFSICVGGFLGGVVTFVLVLMFIWAAGKAAQKAVKDDSLQAYAWYPTYIRLRMLAAAIHTVDGAACVGGMIVGGFNGSWWMIAFAIGAGLVLIALPVWVESALLRQILSGQTKGPKGSFIWFSQMPMAIAPITMAAFASLALFHQTFTKEGVMEDARTELVSSVTKFYGKAQEAISLSESMGNVVTSERAALEEVHTALQSAQTCADFPCLQENFGAVQKSGAPLAALAGKQLAAITQPTVREGFDNLMHDLYRLFNGQLPGETTAKLFTAFIVVFGLSYGMLILLLKMFVASKLRRPETADEQAIHGTTVAAPKAFDPAAFNALKGTMKDLNQRLSSRRDEDAFRPLVARAFIISQEMTLINRWHKESLPGPQPGRTVDQLDAAIAQLLSDYRALTVASPST
ncbi:hypothetical protein KBD59_04010 [Candidatus Gracilibacteria bacterium]|nr:hypothetical protein [Candidatus Gracilibacteria bacterium]